MKEPKVEKYIDYNTREFHLYKDFWIYLIVVFEKLGVCDPERIVKLDDLVRYCARYAQ